ncbi:MAG: DUF4838 domain-containing protein [Candidatus Omnitrophica bacterium]|nr:DUF4838 domain-containing protein [Candidatus Omnitrophota bacterium]
MKRREVCFSFLLLTTSLFANEVFFDQGKTDWKIYLYPEAEPAEKYAAEELQKTLKKISGADFPILTTQEKEVSHGIILGDLKNPLVREKNWRLKISPGEKEQIAVYAIDNCLYCVGNQPRAVLYAVYTFLQKELGVRWLWPGPDGEFVPKKKRYLLPELRFGYQPGFLYRGFHLCGDWREAQSFKEWMARNFINIYRHASSPSEKKYGFYSLWSSHNARLAQSLFSEHPEYFAEVKGRRYVENICFSHPETERLIAEELANYIRKRPYVEILSLFPADNQTYCRCDRCNQVDVSTAWFQFYNRVTSRLKTEFPHLKFATLAYQGYRNVPNCQIENTHLLEYCAYSRCHVHPFSQTNCQLNQNTLVEVEKWKKTGLGLGFYGYEFDIFTTNHRFVPFLTMLDEEIKTLKRAGFISIIPEISLSPKAGPETMVLNVQNRLPAYLYARLLWNPEEKMSDILSDWCQTVFNVAADTMYQYYLLLDQAWSSLPVHRTILGDAANTAELFLSPALREKAVSLLNAATEVLGDCSLPEMARSRMALQREKVLLRQWDNLVELKNRSVRYGLPLLQKKEDIEKIYPQIKLSQPTKENGFLTEVRLAWTEEALLFQWTGKPSNNHKTSSVLPPLETVEIFLSPGLAGPTWHFLTNSLGITQAYRYLNHQQEKTWTPNWKSTISRQTDIWTVLMNIPFSSLEETPVAGDVWQIKLRHQWPGFKKVAFPEKESMALLLFTTSQESGRKLLWWSGAPEKDKEKELNLIPQFLQTGWEMERVTTETEILAAYGNCHGFWFRHPDGPNKIPLALWKQHLVPAISSGTFAIFESYWNIPLDQYFNQPELKVKISSVKDLPLAARKSVFIAPGDWTSKPFNILPSLKNRVTPAYGFIPENRKEWVVLATAPRTETETFPYILLRKYGQGLIILLGSHIYVSPVQLLENLYRLFQSEKNCMVN